MRNILSNAWHLTEGVRFQLIAAITLVIIVSILFFAIFRQSDPATELSPAEQAYPQATPQPFRHQEEEDTGTLVVTSNVDGATVLLDAEEHPSPEDPIKRGQRWPQNTTPFTVEGIPVGEHVLIARKPPFYDFASVSFEIKKDQVTRVHVELIPLRLGN